MTGHVTLDQVVRSLIADEGSTLHYWLPYMHQALQGEQEWRMDFGVEILTKELVVNSDLSVDYPDDLLKWSKLGVLIGDRLVSFTPDRTLLNKPECLNEPRKPFSSVYQDEVREYHEFINFYQGSIGRASYYGAKMPGYFVDDSANRRFILSDEIKAKTIYLEYTPNGFKSGSETFVDERAVTLLKNWILWNYYKKHRRYGPESAKARAWEMEYYKEKDNIVGRLNPISYEDILSISRTYKTQKSNP